jgi:hypothetical protein
VTIRTYKNKYFLSKNIFIAPHKTLVGIEVAGGGGQAGIQQNVILDNITHEGA